MAFTLDGWAIVFADGEVAGGEAPFGGRVTLTTAIFASKRDAQYAARSPKAKDASAVHGRVRVIRVTVTESTP